MNQAMIDKAYDLAHDEIADGQNRVMILFPSRHPSCVRNREKGIFIRYSDEPNSLMSVPIDTLIVAGEPDDDWDAHGIQLATEKTRVARNAKIRYTSTG